MSASAESIASTASSAIEREGGFGQFLVNFLGGGIAYQIYRQTVDGIEGFGTIIFGPARALGEGLIQLVDVFIGGLGDVFGAATEATVRSFASGIGAALGPFAQPFGAGIVIVTLAIFIYSVNQLEFNPASFLSNLRR
jgi:hypothetical protein